MINFEELKEKIDSMSEEERRKIMRQALEASGIEYKEGNNSVIFNGLLGCYYGEDERTLEAMLSKVTENLKEIRRELSAIHEFLTGTIPPTNNINTANCLIEEARNLRINSDSIKELIISISNYLGIDSFYHSK